LLSISFIFLSDIVNSGLKMSLLLGAYLEKVMEEDFEKQKEEINEDGLRRFKALMLAIKKAEIRSSNPG